MFLNLFHGFWEMQNKRDYSEVNQTSDGCFAMFLSLQHHTKPEPQRSKHNKKRIIRLDYTIGKYSSCNTIIIARKLSP